MHTMKTLSSQPFRIPTNYELLQVIGVGAFAHVHLCRDKDTGGQMAVKQVQCSPSCRKTKQALNFLKNEIEIMKKLQHPHVVQYYGADSDTGVFNIFMEFMSGGSAKRYIQHNGPLSNTATVVAIRHVLLGLDYLHKENIIHRDLKASNVLRTETGVYKIADFGCSKKFEECSELKAFSYVGTSYWMSPEVLNNQG